MHTLYNINILLSSNLYTCIFSGGVYIYMDKILALMLKYKKVIVLAFIIITAVCMFASTFVVINYNLMDYLPDTAPSTIALNVMNEQYTDGVPNARVMVRNVTVPQVLEVKKKIEKVDGVEKVTWLDDTANVYQPFEFIETKTLEEYYKDNNALLTVTINEDKEKQAVADIRSIIGNEGAMSGQAVNSATAMTLTEKEVQKIMVLAVILVFIILILTTTSYFEPVLFLITIGIAIAINRGTNLFFGSISFVTNSAGSILQLAVSMDYSIFLVHRFGEMREQYDDVNTAMVKAVKKSFGSVMSSGFTTVIGFAALILMRFKIGPDMGIVMAKAIGISLVSVLLFLPCATLLSYKLIDKTQHKMFMPPFKKFGEIVFKFHRQILVVFVILTIPSLIGQKYNDFTYGQTGVYGEGTQLGDDTDAIEQIFGKSNLMVLMVPKGEPSVEQELSQRLLREDKITSLLSYSETVGVTIPEEFVPSDTLKQLVSAEYTRFVITVDTSTEGDDAFNMTEIIRSIAKKYYGNKYLLVGETVNSYDLKDVVTSDNTWVNIVSIGAIALILLYNFKSLSLPFILLAVIESSVWMNLTVPYLQGETLFYIGYLIISSIQLGATVDYAILFTDRYIENRVGMNKYDAARQTLADTSLSIITSALILTLAGFMLGFMSTNGIISQLGVLVGRGAVLSSIMVLLVLPSMLSLFDKFIQKTTLNLNFYKGDASK